MKRIVKNCYKNNILNEFKSEVSVTQQLVPACRDLCCAIIQQYGSS